MKLRLIATIFTILLAAIAANSQNIELPFYFSDNMVMQRGATIPIMGKADPGQKVVIAMTKANRPAQMVNAKTDKDGNFRGELKPMKASGPYVLSIRQGRDVVEFKNVMVGDVYMCSGEFGMSCTMNQSGDPYGDIFKVTDDNLRYLSIKPDALPTDQKWGSSTLEELNQGKYMNEDPWLLSTALSAKDFSAIGVHFGKNLRDNAKDIAIGIICNAMEGAPIQSFIEESALSSVSPKIMTHNGDNDLVKNSVRERKALNISRSSNPSNQVHPYNPSAMYRFAVEPLNGFPVKAVLWYQGESNTNDADLYSKMFKGLVTSWREKWQNPTLPFYIVQAGQDSESGYAAFRNAQRQLCEDLENCTLVPSADLTGDEDIYKILGKRLANIALSDFYEKEDINGRCPSPSAITTVTILNSGKEILIGYKNGESLYTKDGKDPGPFEVSEDTKTWTKVSARIEGSNIVLTIPKEITVLSNIPIRYGWNDSNAGNLVNGNGIPAPTWTNVK